MPARHRVLIVSAAMGGGHLQISHELRRRLTERGHEVAVVDLLELMPRPAGAWLVRLYPWLVAHARLYELVYRVFFLAEQRQGERVGVPVRLALPGLRRLLRRFRPDATVSTYHLAAMAVGRLRARGEPAGTAATVLTEFAVHDLWIHPATDVELAISPPAAAAATARSGRHTPVCGPVVRPEFTRQQAGTGDGERTGDGHGRPARLGVPEGERVALVVTGSLGLGGSTEEAVAAVAAHPGWVPVVVCGRNDALRERLAERCGDAVVLGWVDDMAGLMSAADVLVDNACGMCAKEALGLGLPVATFQPIPGHGRHDAHALADLGLTDIADDAPALLRALDRLAADPWHRADRSARGRALFVADAAALVERELPAGGPDRSPAPLAARSEHGVPVRPGNG